MEKKVEITAEYMSYTQAMKYLGFKSRSALEIYIAQGLPVIKVGRSKRISKTAIDKFMAEHTVIEGDNHDDTK